MGTERAWFPAIARHGKGSVAPKTIAAVWLLLLLWHTTLKTTSTQLFPSHSFAMGMALNVSRHR
jgi:hypothetical protein